MQTIRRGRIGAPCWSISVHSQRRTGRTAIHTARSALGNTTRFCSRRTRAGLESVHIAPPGHWNHEDAPAVDFAYLFLDEVDLTPPTIESVTVVTGER